MNKRRIFKTGVLVLILLLSVSIYGYAEEKGILSGVVYNDMNLNGKNDNESYAKGLAIDLFKNNQLVMSTTSNASGSFSFNDISEGEYKIRVTKPFNAQFTIIDNQPNGLELDINTKYAWLKYNGSTIINVKGAITNLEIPIHLVAVVRGKVILLDNSGEEVNGNYAKDYRVQLYDNDKLLKEVVVDSKGSYILDYFVANKTSYRLKFLAPSNSGTIPSVSNEYFNVSLSPGVETKQNYYITDKQSPNLVIATNSSVNPTEVIINASDSGTAFYTKWTISKDNVVYYEGGTNESRINISEYVNSLLLEGNSGKYTINAVTTDAAGNTVTFKKSFTLDDALIDNPPLTSSNIEANDFEITIGDLGLLVDSNTVEEGIISRAKAKAWIEDYLGNKLEDLKVMIKHIRK